MKDSRGVDRGRCSQCPCSEFQQLASGSVRCSCGHAPTKHENLSAPCSPSLEPSVDHVAPTAIDSTVSATVVTSFQDVAAPLVCSFPNCKKPAFLDPNTGESQDVCQDHIETVFSPDMGLYQFPELTHHFQLTQIDGEEALTDDEAVPSAPKCSNPLCFRTCCPKEDGTFFDYCGRTCRNEYLKNSSPSKASPLADGQDDTAPVCSNPSCCRTCHPKEDGSYFDYCGRSCRDQYLKSRPQETTLPPVSLEMLHFRTRDFQMVAGHFTSQWVKPSLKPVPKKLTIFKVHNQSLESRFLAYTRSRGNLSAEHHFHGTALGCDLANNMSACKLSDCGVCGICRHGFDQRKIGSNISRFKRFGMGMYFAPNSSKCHDYTQGCNGYRALLLCDVAPGRKCMLQQDRTNLKSPPQGYNSVYGKHGGNLNYDEIVLYDVRAILPKYVIMYQKDGIEQIAT